MKQTYRVLAYCVAGGVVLQAAFIALGTFMWAHKIDNNNIIDKHHEDNIGFTLHGIFALIVALLALILLIVSFTARVQDGVKWAGYVFGAVVLQFVFAIIAHGVPAIGILHGANAFLVMALAGITAHRVDQPTSRRSSTVPA